MQMQILHIVVASTATSTATANVAAADIATRSSHPAADDGTPQPASEHPVELDGFVGIHNRHLPSLKTSSPIDFLPSSQSSLTGT